MRPHVGLFRFMTPLLGVLIIASPLPDEIGLALLGFSRAKTFQILPIAFIMNFIGIYAIAVIAHYMI